MKEREALIQEFWRRMSTVTGVQKTARNPKTPPTLEDLPCIQFFEMADNVREGSARGGKPVYRRELQLVLETFYEGSSEAASSQELGSFVEDMKSKLYEGGSNLGGTCSMIEETQASRILRPQLGEHVAGIALVLLITYIEDTTLL